MAYPINFYTIRECPMCNSGEIEIRERFDALKRKEEWILICRHCGYKLTQDKPF